MPAPLSGNVFSVAVKPGDSVAVGDVIVVLEAMKMETEIRATEAGKVYEVAVKVGDSVKIGEALLTLV
jgi:oxaloacetate decarboxylase alpha subunit